MKVKKIAVLALTSFLMASLCMNVYLYQKVVNQYQSLQAVRLDPTSARRYSAANARIPEPPSGVSRIVFFGDSRIAGWNPLPNLEKDQLLNRGVPGETTAQAVLRLKRDVLTLQPDIAVVQTGINDLKNIGVFPERKDEIVNSCWENLETVAGQIADRDIQLVILTIFPPGPVDLRRRAIWSSDIHQGIDQVNEKIRRLQDRGIIVVDCDILLAFGRSIKPEYAKDMFHLNSAGYETLNGSLSPILQELIQNSLKLNN
ncbi:SGNH/GDSL hydrolase family protein [Planctomycetota bacterium]